MRSIRVNIDKPDFTINPTNCSPFTVDSQGIGDQGTVTDFSSYFHVDNCSVARLQAEDDDPPDGRAKGTRRTAEPAAEVRPDDPSRRRQHQIDFGDAAKPPSRSTSATSATSAPRRSSPKNSAPAARRSARRRPRRRCSTSRSPARSTRFRAPAACRNLPSSSTARSTSCRGPKPRPITKGGAGELQTTVPVVPDAPIGHFALTVFGGKTGYLVNTRSLCGRAPVTEVDYIGPERQDADSEGQGQDRLRQEEGTS